MMYPLVSDGQARFATFYPSELRLREDYKKTTELAQTLCLTLYQEELALRSY